MRWHVTSLVFPTTITELEDSAFYYLGGDSGKDLYIYFLGDVDMWDNEILPVIRQSTNNNPLTSASTLTYFYSEEYPTASQWVDVGRWWHYDNNGDKVFWSRT